MILDFIVGVGILTMIFIWFGLADSFANDCAVTKSRKVNFVIGLIVFLLFFKGLIEVGAVVRGLG